MMMFTHLRLCAGISAFLNGGEDFNLYRRRLNLHDPIWATLENENLASGGRMHRPYGEFSQFSHVAGTARHEPWDGNLCLCHVSKGPGFGGTGFQPVLARPLASRLQKMPLNANPH
jgi:hypothetical protein